MMFVVDSNTVCVCYWAYFSTMEEIVKNTVTRENPMDISG